LGEIVPVEMREKGRDRGPCRQAARSPNSPPIPPLWRPPAWTPPASIACPPRGPCKSWPAY